MADSARARVKRARPGALDVAASALSRVLPRPLTPWVSQARLDLRGVMNELRAHRAPPFSTKAAPLQAPTPLAEIDPLAHVLPRGLAERYATLRRDVAMVRAELRGHRAPSIVPRRSAQGGARGGPEARTEVAVAPTTTRTLEVMRVIAETDEARTIELRDVTGAALPFVAGQFLTLHVTLEGVPLRRAYSLARSPDAADRVRITVKRVEGGRVSRHLVEALSEGAHLEAHGPSGSFVAPTDENARRLVLVAGGSGITPIASIIRDVLANAPHLQLVLLYGNRRERDVIFRDELGRLARTAAPGRFTLHHVLAEPEVAEALGRVNAPSTGLLDESVLGALFDAHGWLEPLTGAAAPTLVLSCGPAPMMAAVREVLAARGIAPERLLEEKYLSPADATRPVGGAPQPITIEVTGPRGTTRHALRVAPSQTVLEAAVAANVALPHSCQMGGCGACRVRGHGALVMDEPNCLSAEEKREGWVLTCVAHATGPAHIEVSGGPRSTR